MINSKQDLIKCLKIDLYRNTGSYSKKQMIKTFLNLNSQISLLLHFRVCQYYALQKKKNPFQFICHSLFYLRFIKLQSRCGIELNQRTDIGYGLRLPHKGCIVIHPLVKIGNYCEIMQGVTIGNNILKDRDAVAQIGDNVMICAGAKIIGGVSIGNGAIIGANSVVNKDIADSMIVAGAPARNIKKNDNMAYLINCGGFDEERSNGD